MAIFATENRAIAVTVVKLRTQIFSDSTILANTMDTFFVAIAIGPCQANHSLIALTIEQPQ